MPVNKSSFLAIRLDKYKFKPLFKLEIILK